MINKEKVFEIFDKVLKGTDDVQLTFSMDESIFIRYANSFIHQNSILNDVKVFVKVINKNRIASSVAPYLETKLIKNAIKEARKIARVSKPIDDLPPFVSSSTATSTEETNRNIDVKLCFNVVKKIIKKSGKYSAYGILKSGNVTWAIGNSAGLRLFQSIPMDYVSIIYINNKHSAFKSFNTLDFDIDKLDDLKKKIMFKSEPHIIEPGEYTVILESPAVASILGHMGYLSFNAKAVYEKTSFFQENKKVFSENVTIYDDKDYESGFPFHFDEEGIERKKVTIIEKGICKNVTCDRYYGKKIGKDTTGHSSGGIVSGPIPNHLVMEKGNSSLEDLVSSVDNGIYVSNFHYVNTVRPFDVTLTGMTRYGTFLIKNGKIVKPLKNLRFTQSMVEAFSNIESISSEIEVHTGNDFYSIPTPSHTICPSVKISRFRFNGISDDSKTI